MKEREYNYDLLRAVSAFAVVLGHVAALFIETAQWDYFDGLPMNHPLVSVVITALCRFSVPAFLMLSGAFVLGNPKTKDAASFYRRSWRHVGIPALAAMIAGVVYSLFCGLVLDHTGVMPAVEALISGAPFYHLWYLPIMAGTYLLAPWICRLREEVTPEAFAKLAVGMTVAGCLGLWLNPPVASHWNIGEAFCYTGYFMLGYVLRETNRGKSGGWLFIAAALLLHACSGVLVYRAVFVSGMDRALAEHRYFMSYAPLTVLASVLMFAGFARLKVHFSSGVFAAHTYSIYLIHAFLLDIISRLSRAVNGQRWLCHLDARFAILLLAVLIYVLSCGLGILLHKICAQSKKAVKA